jgi:hypothetical protein
VILGKTSRVNGELQLSQLFERIKRKVDRTVLRAYFTPCRSWISPYAGPRFHVMPVQDFTACRSKISRQAGQDFTENQAGKF